MYVNSFLDLCVCVVQGCSGPHNRRLKARPSATVFRFTRSALSLPNTPRQFALFYPNMPFNKIRLLNIFKGILLFPFKYWYVINVLELLEGLARIKYRFKLLHFIILYIMYLTIFFKSMLLLLLIKHKGLNTSNKFTMKIIL